MTDLANSKPVYTKTSPCIAKIHSRTALNPSNKNKQTFHISLNIEGSNLHFTPGDSLGILPQNDPTLIRDLLSFMDLEPTSFVIDPRSQESLSLLNYLTSKVNLSRISTSLLETLTHSSSKKDKITDLLHPEKKTELTSFLQGKDLLDVFEELDVSKIKPETILPHLSPLLPRFYSISSSLKSHENEVHLLVALSSYEHKKGPRFGVASHFLCNLAKENHTEIPLYVQPSKHFKIPEDSSKNLIMIGPGTGVAPYRAFLQERAALNAEGNNWLFFGERNRDTDFFYKDFWDSFSAQGKLKLSTAFSRDQEEKIYVQHKLLEEAAEVWRWLENGAYFYVCGDADKMAKDVEAALLQIIQQNGHTEETAKAYLKNLKVSKRYLADVY